MFMVQNNIKEILSSQLYLIVIYGLEWFLNNVLEFINSRGLWISFQYLSRPKSLPSKSIVIAFRHNNRLQLKKSFAVQ